MTRYRACAAVPLKHKSSSFLKKEGGVNSQNESTAHDAGLGMGLASISFV